MIKLKIQKNKLYLNLFVPSKSKKNSTIPPQVGLTKQYNYSIVSYYLIIILQKYGLTMSKGLRKVFITKLLKY